MKNNRKTVITLLLAFVIALASVCAGSSATCLAGNKKTAYKKAAKAYQEFISKDIKINGDSVDKDSAEYAIVDVNYDNTPELVIRTVEQFGESCYGIMYTYNNGKVCELTTFSHGWFGSYKGCKLISKDYLQLGYSYEKYYKISKGKLELAAEHTDDTYVMANSDPEGEVFKIKDKKTTKSKFNKWLKKNKVTKNAVKIKYKSLS